MTDATLRFHIATGPHRLSEDDIIRIKTIVWSPICFSAMWGPLILAFIYYPFH